MSNELFDQVVHITEEYLGPAAPRFVTRQISFHLGKTPDQLSVDDIPELAEWAKITLALLTDDKKLVLEYNRKLTNLSVYS